MVLAYISIQGWVIDPLIEVTMTDAITISEAIKTDIVQIVETEDNIEF